MEMQKQWEFLFPSTTSSRFMLNFPSLQPALLHLTLWPKVTSRLSHVEVRTMSSLLWVTKPDHGRLFRLVVCSHLNAYASKLSYCDDSCHCFLAIKLLLIKLSSSISSPGSLPWMLGFIWMLPPHTQFLIAPIIGTCHSLLLKIR